MNSYSPRSRRDLPRFPAEAERIRAGRAFDTGARRYDAVRPGYPPEVLTLLAGHRQIADVGAGTGKLTAQLRDAGHELVALDPSPDMARVLRERVGVPVWRATAEATALADAAVDALACAQTWHWVDVDRASTEFDRVVRPGGAVLLVWNNLDVSQPWILRLSRIMHAGDIHKEGFLPWVSAPWRIDEVLRTTWTQYLTPEQLYLLTQTRSYWLKSSAAVREKVTANLRWYLYDRLGFQPGQLLAVPYRCDAFVLRRP
ncbi:class I SAM-dependent methyltransferase [Corynebacterium halotolerans]|uniref:class I SAM-dependent methyltransferase n=1 Tax=Corynebacterium halotolerans TaxID=225326 RepID=UPI003CEAAB0F